MLGRMFSLTSLILSPVSSGGEGGAALALDSRGGRGGGGASQFTFWKMGKCRSLERLPAGNIMFMLVYVI